VTFAIKVRGCINLTVILYVFGPHFFGVAHFLGVATPNVLDLHYKIEPVSDQWQSFAAIGRGASEIWR